MKKGDCVTKIKGRICVITPKLLDKYFPVNKNGMHEVVPFGVCVGENKEIYWQAVNAKLFK